MGDHGDCSFVLSHSSVSWTQQAGTGKCRQLQPTHQPASKSCGFQLSWAAFKNRRLQLDSGSLSCFRGADSAVCSLALRSGPEPTALRRTGSREAPALDPGIKSNKTVILEIHASAEAHEQHRLSSNDLLMSRNVAASCSLTAFKLGPFASEETQSLSAVLLVSHSHTKNPRNTLME